jgi:NAD(P)-dependent dehydrogenase (short-subunit alcohol dehydrogenase family)
MTVGLSLARLLVVVAGIAIALLGLYLIALPGGPGTIVGIASVAGYRGFPRSEAYGATKAAEINMLEALRIDLRPMGITVQTVCPGFVRTDLTAKNTFPMPFMLEPDDAARDRSVRRPAGRRRGKAAGARLRRHNQHAAMDAALQVMKATLDRFAEDQ